MFGTQRLCSLGLFLTSLCVLRDEIVRDGTLIERVAVSLGVIKTPLHDESSYAGMGALHPIGRVGEIEDVVAGVLYLESAPFVTGEILHIDGGQSAGH
jgi:NAD(P)-dependent dehydrogenase (short-subunit alcohol dehydrogenase family)